MASKKAALVAAVASLAIVAGAVAYGIGARSGSKGKPDSSGQRSSSPSRPQSDPGASDESPPVVPLKLVSTLKANGTLPKDYTYGDSQLSEFYEVQEVSAQKDDADPAGTYSGTGVKGTLSGVGTLSLKCKVTGERRPTGSGRATSRRARPPWSSPSR